MSAAICSHCDRSIDGACIHEWARRADVTEAVVDALLKSRLQSARLDAARKVRDFVIQALRGTGYPGLATQMEANDDRMLARIIGDTAAEGVMPNLHTESVPVSVHGANVAVGGEVSGREAIAGRSAPNNSPESSIPANTSAQADAPAQTAEPPRPDPLREIRWQLLVILSMVWKDRVGGGANSPSFPPIPESFK